MSNGISGNGYRIVTIDMGRISCVNEPIIIDLKGTQFILRYKAGDDDAHFGKVTLEALAD